MESCKHCIVKTKILNETIQELRLELSLCQRQLQQYKNNQMEEIHSRRLQALNAYKIEYDSTHDILANTFNNRYGAEEVLWERETRNIIHSANNDTMHCNYKKLNQCNLKK